MAAHRTIQTKNIQPLQPLPKIMSMHNIQVKNKCIEIETCSKTAAIEPELYCKITPMYRWADIHQINVKLTEFQKQLNRNNDLFKVAANLLLMQRRRNQ